MGRVTNMGQKAGVTGEERKFCCGIRKNKNKKYI
jgi:hypothetical protein